MEFFAAGAQHEPLPTCPPDCDGSPHRERLMLAANRTGKTEGVGGYEVTLHCIGEYPDWWVGRRFDRPTKIWAAGDTSNTVRDILQAKLLGPVGNFGTGLIPKKNIDRVTWKRNVPEAVQDVYIRSKSGGLSTLTMKCFGAGTRIKMADGSMSLIENVEIGQSVMCADGRVRRVVESYAYLEAPLLRLTTRSGETTVTPNHGVFTLARGKIAASEVVIGDVLQIASPDCGAEPKPDWLVKMTALMIGDGCMRAKTPFFACNEPSIVEEVKACLPDDLYVVPVTNTISYKISSTGHKCNRLKNSLVEDGLWGLKATQKFIPQWVFRLPIEQKRTFLRWLWGCDGTINPKSATYATSSIRLASDVRMLLWDCGIYAPFKGHMVGCNGKRFQAYYISLYGHNRIAFTSIGKLNRGDECSIKPREKGPPGEVTEIESLPPGRAYCVAVEEAHELIADGYRSANSYDQGRESFQGTELDLVWLDEEPPMAIYAECLIRTMTTNGMILCTFTPLLGLSDTVLSFLPNGKLPERHHR